MLRKATHRVAAACTAAVAAIALVTVAGTSAASAAFPHYNHVFLMIEENHNEDDIGAWIAKHNRYAQLQAREEMSRVPPAGRFFGSPDDRVRWLKRAWARQPLYVRPFLYFFYRYFIRLGILDGKQGLIFHFMQALWYRLLVDVNIAQLRAESK